MWTATRGWRPLLSCVRSGSRRGSLRTSWTSLRTTVDQGRALLRSVCRLPWDDCTNTTARLIDIPRATRNEMHMAVHDSLSCRLATVHAHVEAFDRFVSSEDGCSDLIKKQPLSWGMRIGGRTPLMTSISGGCDGRRPKGNAMACPQALLTRGWNGHLRSRRHLWAEITRAILSRSYIAGRSTSGCLLLAHLAHSLIDGMSVAGGSRH
jgi:hypothetical protein